MLTITVSNFTFRIVFFGLEPCYCSVLGFNRSNTVECLRLPLLLSFCQVSTATPSFVPDFCHPLLPLSVLPIIRLAASSSTFPLSHIGYTPSPTNSVPLLQLLLFFFKFISLYLPCFFFFSSSLNVFSTPPLPSSVLFAPVYLHCSTRWFVL